MLDPEDFHELYAQKRTPWDTGRPDHNLVRMVDEGIIGPARILDIGCGTGTDALWLAGHGFEVTGIDLVDTALAEARKRGAEQGVDCNFIKAIFPAEPIQGAPFALAYDRGCFHSQKDSSARKEFAMAVAAALVDRGVWLSLVGSCDDPDPGDPGPPRLTMAEVAGCVEPFFEIELIQKTFIESNRGDRHRAWVCLFRKRV